jgi:hypothetical protein
MKRFVVKADDFFDADDELAEKAFARYSTADIRARCQAPIEALIERFELAGTSLLSIGASGGHEEFWMHRAGCRMTFIDLDETGTIEPFLASLPPADEGAADALVYLIGDADEYVRTTADRFGCCYVSSFPPDEFRRQEIQQAHRPRYHTPLYGSPPPARRIVLTVNGAFRRLTGRRPIRVRTWPDGEAPFAGTLSTAVERCLEPGGLFVNQSYAGGVEIPDNPQFVELMREQLRALGAELIALYHFEPGYTSVSLTVAYKGSPEEARAFAERISAHPDITDFHGRSDVDRTIRSVALA